MALTNWRQALRARAAEHPRRRPLLFDQAAMQEHDMRGHLAGKGHLMGDEQHRPASSASDRMTFRTSPTSSGSSAEVGSSNSMTCGSTARALGNGGALLLAAGEKCRILILLLVKTDAVEQRLGLLDGVGLADLENVDGRLDDILQDRHVLPQVEALEHHSGPAADALDLAMVDRRQVAVAAGLQLPPPRPRRGCASRRQLKQIDAAQERALPEPEAPMTDRTSPSLAESETPRNTSSGPKRL